MYKIYSSPLSENIVVIRDFDNALIPPDTANTDYQQYLAWVAEGNTPEEWLVN